MSMIVIFLVSGRIMQMKQPIKQNSDKYISDGIILRTEYDVEYTETYNYSAVKLQLAVKRNEVVVNSQGIKYINKLLRFSAVIVYFLKFNV